MASASAPSKKTRAPVAGNLAATCLVDGCKSDLSKCRDYHRRHKVCELHSKTPKVTIGGQEQRFCQQCSRFHSLVEFDEGKRSCRKRLDGHNRRRRKPRPDALTITSGKFLTHCQGGRYLTFGGEETYNGNGVISDCVYYSSHPELSFMPNHGEICGATPHHPYAGGKHLTFLQVTNQNLPESSNCDLRDPAMSSRANGATCQEMCFDGLNQLTDSNAGGALSLLSSPLSENRYLGLSSIFHNGLLPSAHSTVPELHRFDNNLAQPNQTSLLLSGSRSNGDHHCQEMFQVDSEGSSASGPNHTLAFSWD